MDAPDESASVGPTGASEPEPEPASRPPGQQVCRSVRLMVKQVRLSAQLSIRVLFSTSLTRCMLQQNDDLRKDQIVLDSIELMCTILKTEIPSLTLPLVRYKVLPTAVDSGMVEVVGESTTLYAIEQRVGYSIAQYLIDHNGKSILPCYSI